MSGKLSKSGIKWYFMANNLSLNGPNSWPSSSWQCWVSELIPDRWRTTVGRLEGCPMLSATISCCWGTQRSWHCSSAQGSCEGAGKAEKPWSSQWSQGSHGYLLHPRTDQLLGSYWACLRMKQPQHCAQAAAPFELAESWQSFLPSTPLISAL